MKEEEKVHNMGNSLKCERIFFFFFFLLFLWKAFWSNVCSFKGFSSFFFLPHFLNACVKWRFPRSLYYYRFKNHCRNCGMENIRTLFVKKTKMVEKPLDVLRVVLTKQFGFYNLKKKRKKKKKQGTDWGLWTSLCLTCFFFFLLRVMGQSGGKGKNVTLKKQYTLFFSFFRELPFSEKKNFKVYIY